MKSKRYQSILVDVALMSFFGLDEAVEKLRVQHACLSKADFAAAVRAGRAAHKRQ